MLCRFEEKKNRRCCMLWLPAHFSLDRTPVSVVRKHSLSIAIGRAQGVSVWRRFFRWWSQRNVEDDIATLRAVVHRIVEVAQPDQVILFGSAARGQLRPNSDFDLLVIKSDVPDTLELTRYLRAHLFDIRMPIDIIVATPEEIEASRFKMLGTIYERGRRIYPRPQMQRY